MSTTGTDRVKRQEGEVLGKSSPRACRRQARGTGRVRCRQYVRREDVEAARGSGAACTSSRTRQRSARGRGSGSGMLCQNMGNVVVAPARQGRGFPVVSKTRRERHSSGDGDWQRQKRERWMLGEREKKKASSPTVQTHRRASRCRFEATVPWGGQSTSRLEGGGSQGQHRRW